jgi:hypothetical protein
MATAAQHSASVPAAEVEDDAAEEAAESILMQQLPPMSYVFSDRVLELIRSYTDAETLLQNLKYLCKTQACVDIYNPKKGGVPGDGDALEKLFQENYTECTLKVCKALQDAGITTPGTRPLPVVPEMFRLTSRTARGDTLQEMRNDIVPAILKYDLLSLHHLL